MKVLVTGGSGFIGSNFIHFLLNTEPEVEVYNLDNMTYAADPKNLQGIDSSRYNLIIASIEHYAVVKSIVKQVDVIVNFAAESHVDRSIEDANVFLQTNIIGTNTLLRAALDVNPGVRFLHVGTDEVYGSQSVGKWADEEYLLNPVNPYAASKAAADLIALAYYQTHRLDVTISRSTNNYGPRQHVEKLIPKFITTALANKPLPLYDDGSQIRDWLWVEDNCKALWTIVQRGKEGEIYNVGAKNDPEITNLELTRKILRSLGKSDDLIEFKVGARPGHDQRYAIDNTKIYNLGWQPEISLEQGLKETISWYLK